MAYRKSTICCFIWCYTVSLHQLIIQSSFETPKVILFLLLKSLLFQTQMPQQLKVPKHFQPNDWRLLSMNQQICLTKHQEILIIELFKTITLYQVLYSSTYCQQKHYLSQTFNLLSRMINEEILHLESFSCFFSMQCRFFFSCRRGFFKLIICDFKSYFFIICYAFSVCYTLFRKFQSCLLIFFLESLKQTRMGICIITIVIQFF